MSKKSPLKVIFEICISDCNIDYDQCAALFQLCSKLTATGRPYGVINRSISERELGNSLLVKYRLWIVTFSLFALTASWYAPTRVCWVNSCSSLYICRRRKNRFHRGQEEKRRDRSGCGKGGWERRKDRCGKKGRKNPSTDVVLGTWDQRRNDVRWSCLVYPNYIPFIPASASKGRVSHGNFLRLFLRMTHCTLEPLPKCILMDVENDVISSVALGPYSR